MPKVKSSLSLPIYEHLLERIMRKELTPGDHIPETTVAADFGTSRTPVREAIRRLGTDGLVTIRPNRFAEVSAYSAQSIQDIGILRIALDSMAIKLAMLNGSKYQFLHLREIALHCEKGMQTDNDTLRRTADCDFHLELARISGNKPLLRIQNELYLRVNFILLYHQDAVVNKKLHIQQHFDMVDALLAHDEKKALALIQNHLHSFYDLESKYPQSMFDIVNVI